MCRLRAVVPLAAAALCVALAGCTGAEEPTPQPNPVVDEAPALPQEADSRLDLAASSGPGDLADLPERLAGAAEGARFEDVTCEGDLSPSVPMVRCQVLGAEAPYTARLVRTGSEGEVAGVLLSHEDLPAPLEAEPAEPGSFIDYTAGVRLFEGDITALEPESLQLRAELTVNDMGVDRVTQDCAVTEDDAVSCRLTSDAETGSSAQVTLIPAVHTSGNPITLGVVRPL